MLLHGYPTSGSYSKIIKTLRIGNQQIKEYFYACADAFIFPSKYEGFGLPPLEAMACGTPVIASSKSCMPEVLGNAAKFFDPNEPSQIAKVISNTLNNKKLLKQMSDKGIDQVKKYSWTKMARQTLQLYKNILEK